MPLSLENSELINKSNESDDPLEDETSEFYVGKKDLPQYSVDNEDEDEGEGEDEEDEEDEDENEEDEDNEEKLESGTKEFNIDVKQGIDYGDQSISPIQSDVESEDDDYLQKFSSELRENYIKTTHPESIIKNHTEISKLTNETHKTVPFLTKYERTRILGQRAKQINMGDKPYIDIPYDIIDGFLIAELELKAKKLPFIISRPLPDGTAEYWKLADLEII